jgi:hypothetical protein
MLADRLRRYGVVGTARRALAAGARLGRDRYLLWNVRNAPRYADPSSSELQEIERDLRALGVQIEDFAPPAAEFAAFRDARLFPPDYHGGVEGGVWDEKLLEHWISSELLGLRSYAAGDIYVDVAANTSPWAMIVRERFGVEAYAIDLAPGAEFRSLPYYRVENATKTSFADGSVRGASLHCAYEMFLGNDDVNLLSEMARILRPGGKLVITPLYMHTHYCAYSTAEYYGKGYSDPAAKEYVRLDCSGVPSSRKYDAHRLLERVLLPIERLGMRYRLLALRNKSALGQGVYCHFTLEVTR